MSVERVYRAEGRFAEGQEWEVFNRQTQTTARIDGPLAEVLKYHPDWFDLKYKGVKGVEYVLECKCGSRFLPQQVWRLKADEKASDRFQHQDLLIGQCPNLSCAKAVGDQLEKRDVFAWIGVDYFERPMVYNPINWTRHQDWINRWERDLVKVERLQLDPEKHSQKRMGTVTGSIQDRKSGKWRYRDVIGVE